MKSLVLCACVLIFASSSSSELRKQLKNLEDDYKTCTTETNMTQGDPYEMEEIISKSYAEPENAERTRKTGCWSACVLKKQNLMEGTNIKEAQFHTKLNEIIDEGPTLVIAHKIARKCMRKARNITQECEKGFSMFVCITEALVKLQQDPEKGFEILEAEAETEEESVTEQTE